MSATFPARSPVPGIAAGRYGRANPFVNVSGSDRGAYAPPMPDLPTGSRALFDIDGDVAVPSELTRGPWDPRAMHGGPPAALLARAVERCDPGPADFVARLTIEL